MARSTYLVAAVLLVIALRCSKTLSPEPIVKQPRTTTYHNKQIGFTVDIPGDWRVFTTVAEMPGYLKTNYNALQAQGLNVQMIALKQPAGSGPGGFRITSQSLGMTNTQYTEATIKANAADIGRVNYEKRQLAGKSVTFWSGGKGTVQYAEYVMAINGHNLRFTFWGSEKSTGELWAHRVMAGFRITPMPTSINDSGSR